MLSICDLWWPKEIQVSPNSGLILQSNCSIHCFFYSYEFYGLFFSLLNYPLSKAFFFHEYPVLLSHSLFKWLLIVSYSKTCFKSFLTPLTNSLSLVKSGRGFLKQGPHPPKDTNASSTNAFLLSIHIKGIQIKHIFFMCWATFLPSKWKNGSMSDSDVSCILIMLSPSIQKAETEGLQIINLGLLERRVRELIIEQWLHLKLTFFLSCLIGCCQTLSKYPSLV